MPILPRIKYQEFYGEWKGHPIEHLGAFRDITLNHRPGTPIVYLAGDSSLDNKYWVSHLEYEPVDVEIPAIYYHTLKGAKPRPKPDVAFWMNHVLGENASCINAAVEASMLRERYEELLPHDEFIRDSLRESDVLVVSVGANDIAMHPTFSTIWRMLALTWLTRRSSIASGSAWVLPYFTRLFGTQTEAYIERLCSKTKPHAVILCMIYYPLEADKGQTGWADIPLKFLGYDRDPGKLQAAIRTMFELGTASVRVEGTEIVPCKLYEVLDGTHRDEYVARVEPSSSGGRKMAEGLKILIDAVLKKRL